MQSSSGQRVQNIKGTKSYIASIRNAAWCKIPCASCRALRRTQRPTFLPVTPTSSLRPRACPGGSNPAPRLRPSAAPWIATAPAAPRNDGRHLDRASNIPYRPAIRRRACASRHRAEHCRSVLSGALAIRRRALLHFGAAVKVTRRSKGAGGAFQARAKDSCRVLRRETPASPG